MKRIISLVIALATVGVLAQQAFSPATPASTQASTQPATARVGQATTPASAQQAVGPTSSSERSRSRSEYSRSRRFEADTKPSGGSQTVMIPPPKPLSSDYTILTERSMFVKGVFRYVKPGDIRIRESRGPTTVTTQTTSYDPPESKLVLTGVMKLDNEFVAFVENYSSSEMHTLHSGEAIATGKVGPMTLNYIDYISGGHTTRVTIGRTLLGGDPPATRPFAAGSTVAADSSSPSGTSSSGVGALAPPSDSLIERLKKKREAEMAGK